MLGVSVAPGSVPLLRRRKKAGIGHVVIMVFILERSKGVERFQIYLREGERGEESRQGDTFHQGSQSSLQAAHSHSQFEDEKSES